MTAILAVPNSALAVDECGATSPVTCSDASYTSTSDSPIKYENETGGLTLTVKPSGAGTVTITATKLPATTSEAFPGIHLDGEGTLKVLLDGAVKVLNGATRTTVEATFGDGKETFIHPDHKLGSRNDGVYVAYDKDDDAGTTEGMVEVMVGKDAVIGSETAPAGRHGVHAAFLDADDDTNYPAGKIKVTSAGEIHGYYTGIYAKHDGAGDIEIETAEGSVTSMGIRAISFKNLDNRVGSVTIRHHGRIVVKSPVRYAGALTTANVATPLDTDLATTRSDVNKGGIFVTHRDRRKGASAPAEPSSSILIESSGDIDVVANPTHSEDVKGIFVETYGVGGYSVVPVTINVTGGTITASDQGKTKSGIGIYIHSLHHYGGLVKVDLAGEIARTGSKGHGILIYRGTSFDNDKIDPDVNRNVEVTLRSGARIGMDGDEPTVGRHGVYVQNQIYGGKTLVEVESGARIGTMGTPVGGNGVTAEAIANDNDINVMITNEGLIHAKGSGVVAFHMGWGDVDVKHLAGKIIAGDLPTNFGTVSLDHKTKLAELDSRSAGIFAVHGGSKLQTLPGETFEGNDPSTYTADIGKIEITSKADIASKGDGVLAYVKDIDVPADIVFIPIMIDVAGGTITADGHGVYAETASPYEDEDAPKAGRIEVTVGEMATIRAKKDGVHVKGMRTFASDHARKGQYDQTVTINGKVMGGGGDHAGVRMVKGGTLVIGSGGPEARLGAASGVAVHADGALTITMSKTADGRIGWVVGKIQNGDSADTTFAGVEVGKTYLLQDREETKGIFDTTIERKVTLREYADEDYHEFELVSQEEIVREYHDRARVYEALPSVLLEMSAPGGRQARLSATRDGGGAWARVLASDGEREAETSTTAMDTAGHDLSWDFERWGVETGIAVPTDLPGLTLGVSAHYRDGEADVKRGGKIDVSGVGVGASATWRGEDGWYADGELSYTRFEDVDLSSEARGMVASGLDGEGHAIGVEVGRRMEMDGFALVPRGGLTWTWVDIDGFADVSGVTGSGRVSFRSEDSARARVGMLLENGQTYASLDVEREFSESREVMASGARLRSEAESTWARLGVGGVMTLDARGESTLSGEAHYAASDGDNHDYGASVLLKVRF